MEPPPAKKAKVSPTLLSMVVEEWEDNQIEQFSPDRPISGFLWCLRVYDKGKKRRVAVVCSMAEKAELWECTATIGATSVVKSSHRTHTFTSWDEDSHEVVVLEDEKDDLVEGDVIEVEIQPTTDGELLWRQCPVLDSLAPRDGILVIGKKRIQINKQSLASQSLFFDRIFTGDSNGEDVSEISIGDVKYEDMVNFIKMIYRFDGATLTDENVLKVLQLAIRFECKIVEDKVVSYLLSSSCSFSIIEKLLFSEKNNLPFATKVLRSQDYSNEELDELCNSPRSKQLSPETLLILLKNSVS